MADFINGTKEEPHMMVVHELHVDLQMFEGDQALVLFQSDYELPLEASHANMEEADDHTLVELYYGGVHASNCHPYGYRFPSTYSTSSK